MSLFGAIFTAGLAANLAERLPEGVNLSVTSGPSAIRALPAATHDIYLEAFTAALNPVFLSASALAALAFALTWLLKERPLRAANRSETIGGSFGVPRDARSLEELERIVSQLEQRENRWGVIGGSPMPLASRSILTGYGCWSSSAAKEQSDLPFQKPAVRPRWSLKPTCSPADGRKEPRPAN